MIATSRPNTLNLKPLALIVKKLKHFKLTFKGVENHPNFVSCHLRNFNIKLHQLELKAYFGKKVRMPVTDYIFTIKTPLFIVKISQKSCNVVSYYRKFILIIKAKL